MQLHFVGKNFDLTEALKNHATEKFQPIQKRFSHITNVNVVLSVEHKDFIAEATLHYDGTEMHATAQSDDMYQAIDKLCDKLLGQLTKHKDKIIDSHR